MEARKLLIAEGNEEFRLALKDALRGAYRIRSSGEGKETLSLLRSFKPELMILDLMLPGLDGISLLESAAAAGIRPIVLATTRFHNEYVLEACARLGVGYVMVKPCDIPATVERLGDLSSQIGPPALTSPEPRTYVSNLLLSLGIATKLNGYGYLREAVILMSRDPEQSVTKVLYPRVAAMFHCKSTHVERSIRSAIESSWKRRDDRIWHLYFRPGADGEIPKPTNAEFISRLADSLRLNQDN